MSGTITVSPTACFIDSTGIHAPSYQSILSYLQTQYQSIYGSDVYLGNDSQDGQLIAIFALALNDANNSQIAVYNAFSPATAQGAGLSSVVKINGIARLVPSNSNVDLTIVGQATSTIINGIAVDSNSNRWFLPSPVTIPISGQIDVTAFAEFSGAVTASAGTITTIGTPTRGWQSVTNPTDAVPGSPVELDASLRLRQSVSTALPSQAILDGIVGAIYQLSGVIQVQPYENNTSLTDANGIPRNSISLVVEGGSAQDIANTVLLKKTPGTGTYGTTLVTATDASGNPKQINFFRPTSVTITVQVTLAPLLGYTTTVGNSVAAAVAAGINALPIGHSVINSYQYAVAYSVSNSLYTIKSILMSRGGATPSTSDIVIAFNEVATASTQTVVVAVG